MKELDDELRDALRREPAPAGFAERVLQRASEQPQRQAPPRPRLDLTRPLFRWAAAAVLAVAVGGVLEYRSYEKAREERIAGEVAKEQVIKALRLTAAKLQVVQAKVREVGS